MAKKLISNHPKDAHISDSASGGKGESMAMEGRTDEPRACMNIDRELWRETPDDHYAPSIHVTEGGGIGINVGGHVIVMPLRQWYESALRISDNLAQGSEARPGVGGAVESNTADEKGLASRVEELEKDAFRWRLFYPADGTLGVYPAAAKGGSKPYDKRDDYMNGWNAACSAFLAAHSTIRKMVEELQAERCEQLLKLEKAGIVWFSYEDDKRNVTLALNMNDTFRYACADAEDFPVEAIGELHELYEKFGHDGVTAWAARQRKSVPIKECQTERYQEAARWLAGAHAEEK